MSEKYLLMKSVWPELWRTYCWTTTITYKNSTKYALPKRRKKLLYSSYFRNFSPKTYVVQFGVQLKNVDSIPIILWNRNSAIFTDIFTCSCPFVPKRCNTNEIAHFCWSLGMPGANMKHSLSSIWATFVLLKQGSLWHKMAWTVVALLVQASLGLWFLLKSFDKKGNTITKILRDFYFISISAELVMYLLCSLRSL